MKPNPQANKPVQILRSDLTGDYFAITKYKDLGEGRIEATEKFNVTAAIHQLLEEESNKAKIDELKRLDLQTVDLNNFNVNGYLETRFIELGALEANLASIGKERNE